MRTSRWRSAVLLLVIALTPVIVLHAQSKPELQMQQDIRMLQEQIAQLRIAVNTLAEQQKAAADTAAVATKGGAPAGGGDSGGMMGGLKDILFGSTGPRGGKRDGLAEMAAKRAVRTVGSAVGREIVRGVLGSLLGAGRRR